MDTQSLIKQKKSFLAVIAEDATHSLSPFMHSVISKHTNCKIPYYALSIPKERLEEEIPALMQYAKGLNITIPYKNIVLPYLNKVEQDALNINAVNTIAKQDNLLKGFNTDIAGFIDTLAHFGIVTQGAKALVLGSGGVSRAMAYALLKMGARVYMASRHKTISLPECLSKVKLVSYDQIDYSVNIIANGTPVGMDRVQKKNLISLQEFSSLSFVFDSIYTPYYTPLLQQALRLNIPCANGLFMLLAQGLHSRIIWSYPSVDKDVINKIYQSMQIHLLSKELQKTNIKSIALGGFMGVGKSYIGKELAKLIGFNYIDLDKVIEAKHGKIADIFATKGEQAFRAIEAKELEKINFDNTVLSLGGGVLISDKLANLIKSQAFVIAINRPFEDILTNIAGDIAIRPLASSHEQLKELYYMRNRAYKLNSHISIDATMDKEANIIQILASAIYENNKLPKNYS